MLHDRPIRVAI